MATEFINGQWRIPNSWDVDESNQGKISNYSMDFDGTSAEIDLGSEVLFDSTKGFSFSTWIKLDAYSPLYPGICRLKTDQSTGFMIFLSEQNNYQGIVIGSNINFPRLRTTGDISGDFIGVWKHVCVTFDGVNRAVLSSYKIYVDGSPVGLTTAGGVQAVPNSNRLGFANASTTEFNGKIDQTTIFDYALSQDQVTQLAPYLYAFNFNSSRIRLNSTSILQNVSSFTISAWAKKTGGNNDRMIFGSDESGNRGLYISARSGGQYKVLLSTSGSTNDQFTYSTGGADNVWRNIIVNWNGTSINLFIDGVFVYTQAVVNSTGNFSMPVEPSIGSQNGTTSGFGFIGEISNVQIWDSILTSGGATVGQVAGGEIATIYNNSSPLKGTPPQSSNLKGWWRLDDTATFNSGTTVWSVPDASNNSNTGTSVGMTLSSLVLTSLNGGFIANPMALSPKPIAYYQLGDQDANFNGGTWTVPNQVAAGGFVFQSVPLRTTATVPTDKITSNINYTGTPGVPDPFTVSFWMKDSVIGGGSVFFDHDASAYTTTTPKGAFVYFTGGKVIIYLKANFWRYYSLPAGVVLTDNEWRNIVVYMDPASISLGKVWIDGTPLALSNGNPGGGGPNDFTAGFRFYLNNFGSNVMYFKDYEIDNAGATLLYNNGAPLLDTSTLAQAPDHWWKINASDTFDIATSTWTIKDHVGSENGTSVNMDASNLVGSELPNTGGRQGYSPYSIELNGADQFFTVDNSSKNLNTENISISTWFFQDDSAAASGFAAIIINGFSGSGSSYWGLVMRPGNIVRAQLRLLDINGNLAFITEDITQTIVTGQWNHIAMTYDGTTLKGYINGVEETLSLSGASGEIQYATSGMNSQNLLIGKRGTDNLYIDGKISNFAIWGSGLTSTQIATIYNDGLPNDISSLNPLAWWELGAMTGFNGTDTWTAISNSDSNFAAVSEANMAAIDLVNGPGYSDGGIGTSSLVIAKQAPYSFNNALSESMAISNRDDSQASDPYPLIMQLDLTSETSSYTFASPEVSSGATYPYTVDWGDGNIEQITSSGQLVSNRLNHVYDTDTYPRPVVQIGKSTDTGGIKQFYVNNGGSKLQFVDLKQWGQANFTNFVSFRLATKTRITAGDNLKFSGSSLATLLQQAFVANPPSINNWDVSTVTNITSAFLDALSFNQDLNNWDTSSQRSGQSAPGIVMSNVFNGASAFNGNITNWFTGKLVTGLNFLQKAFVFNQDISTKKILAANSPTGVEYVAWDVSNCTTFSQFFYRASAFNQDIGNWNIGGNPSTTAVSCYRMFRSATSFNQDIYTKAISAAASPTGSAYVAWDMSKVNDMEYMFSEGGSAFNGDINNWDTSSVVDMQYMFQQASIFNQDISTKSISAAASPTGSAYIAWDVSSVLNFQRMFRKTILFNKNLRSWNLNSSVTNMTNMFETTTAMNGAAYTDTIVGWAVKHNIGTYAPNNINMGTSPTFDNTRTQNTDNDGTTTDYSTLYGTDWPGTWTEAGSARSYLEEDAGWTNI